MDGDCIIYPNILQGIGVLSNVVIYTLSLRVGKMLNPHSAECFLGMTPMG